MSIAHLDRTTSLSSQQATFSRPPHAGEPPGPLAWLSLCVFEPRLAAIAASIEASDPPSKSSEYWHAWKVFIRRLERLHLPSVAEDVAYLALNQIFQKAVLTAQQHREGASIAIYLSDDSRYTDRDGAKRRARERVMPAVKTNVKK